jgi:microcystin-dependent protein
MSTPYLSEIRMFAFGIVPRGWAQCNGQLMSINSNQALFSLIGTTYGGDGIRTFALPNLQGRVPLHMGTKAGVSYVEGQTAGEVNVTLNLSLLPTHTHLVNANSAADASAASSTTVPGGGGSAGYGSPPNTAMNAAMVGSAGGSQPHTNLQPYLVLNFCICLSGIFPSRG